MSKRAATKLQDGSADKQPSKHKKTTINLTVETKITDINNSCLEKIFNHLSLTDLLNVADSSKLLKKAVESAFTRKYGEKTVDMFGLKQCHAKEHLIKVNDNDNKITIICMKLGLKFFRCFGHLIVKLNHTHFYTSQNYANEIDRYISKYCAESLIDIKFSKSRFESMNDLNKPFSKVEKVVFSHHSMEGHLLEFNKWFPNVRHLQLDYSKVPIQNRIVAHYPHLEHLVIDATVDYVEKEIVSSILRLNPTLRSLHIIDRDGRGGIDAKYYQSVSQHLQNLETLELDVHFNFTNLDDATVHLKNVKKLKINYKSFDPIDEITFSFDGLEEFTFESSVHMNSGSSYALSHMLIDFIVKQQGLTKLVLSCHTYVGPATFFLSERNKLKLASPSLKEAVLKSCIFSEDELMTFLDKCKWLRKFCFKYYSKYHRCAKTCCNSRGEVSCNHFKDFQKRLGNDWCASMDGKGNMELIRAFVNIK